MDSEILTTILTSTVVSTFISTIVAPHVNWRIEKKRIKQENRKKLLESVRQEINREDFERIAFRKKEIYCRISPYLSDKTNQKIRSSSNTGVISVGGQINGDDLLREAINKDLYEQEKKWELV